jgi:hypothetical protein
MESAPVVLEGVVEFVSNDPILFGMMLALVALVFFVYLFLRRTLTSVREGYEDAYRGK